MRELFLESVSGVAGDMFAAAFLDAGLLAADEAREVPALLGLPDVSVEIRRVRRATMAATHLEVVVPPSLRDEHRHPRYRDLDRRIADSGLPDGARDFARKVLRLLAEAEAGAHGTDVEGVAFHEVGEPDSLVDVALAGLCLDRVRPARVHATPVKLGRGLVRIRHGTHPVPPPGSARLATGFPVAAVPDAIAEHDVELSTPTGLAILKALRPAFTSGWPAGRVERQGMGAGSRELEGYPNVFRVALLRPWPEGSRGKAAHAELPYDRDRVVEIACNLDDETGERSAWLLERCLAMGALDAWTHQVVGKKGRPALILTVLAHPAELGRFADWLLRRSATFGLRWKQWDRLKLVRTRETRDAGKGPVRYSVGRTTTGELLKEKPEFDDVAAIWDEEEGEEREG